MIWTLTTSGLDIDDWNPSGFDNYILGSLWALPITFLEYFGPWHLRLEPFWPWQLYFGFPLGLDNYTLGPVQALTTTLWNPLGLDNYTLGSIWALTNNFGIHFVLDNYTLEPFGNWQLYFGIQFWDPWQLQLLQRHGDSRRDGCCQWQVSNTIIPLFHVWHNINSQLFSSLPPFSFLQDLQFAEIFFKSFICSCFARFPLCRDLPAVSDSPLDIHLSKQILLKHWNLPSANCQENHKKLKQI